MLKCSSQSSYGTQNPDFQTCVCVCARARLCSCLCVFIGVRMPKSVAVSVGQASLDMRTGHIGAVLAVNFTLGDVCHLAQAH